MIAWPILVSYSTSSTSSGLKDRPNLKMAAILKISKYFRQVHFDIISENIIANYPRKSMFDASDVIGDVTA